MKKYIIWAPEYMHSNGVRCLYRLAEVLEERGYQAYIYTYYPKKHNKIKYIRCITQENRKNDIVVYPEIVVGNPLGFQNVVRWILYYPGKLGGEAQYDAYELPFTFNRIYSAQGDVFYLQTLDHKLFYRDATIKDEECYFVYKKGRWKDVPEFEGMTEINMRYPSTRKELAALLRRTKTLYSYDDCSQLLDEALLCGCDVKLVRENGFESYQPAIPLISENEALENFIQKTQQMHYRGPIPQSSVFEALR